MTAIGDEEKAAVMRVLDSGVLSGFLAGQLHGGPEVSALEEEWADYFGFKNAVAMNSATSCLIAACGAVGVKTDDLVAVPPLTMSASATCIMPWGAQPFFIDIESNYFCLDPIFKDYSICRAIITVDLFGQSSNPELKKHNLPIIQDASQRPIPGGFGDIVVYSLNYHKHIHCGEGGVACTNDNELARKLRLIRNHAENAGEKYWGFNFRMTEIEAAIARVQLKKLPEEIERRQKMVDLIKNLAPVRPGFQHAWYLFPTLNQGPNTFRYQKSLKSLPYFHGFNGDCPVAQEVWGKLWMVRP